MCADFFLQCFTRIDCLFSDPKTKFFDNVFNKSDIFEIILSIKNHLFFRQGIQIVDFAKIIHSADHCCFDHVDWSTIYSQAVVVHHHNIITIIRGHSTTTWTNFDPILTPSPLK